ncbi:MAG: hypothetical protein ACUVWZ_15775 [Anaerolineae bacterium]
MDRLVSIYHSAPLLFWIGGSIAVYLLIIHGWWRIRNRSFGSLPYGRWLVEIGRFLFYLGIPYLALGGWPRGPYQGLLAPDDLGWVGVHERWSPARWVGAIGAGFGLGLVAFLILLLAWVNTHRITGPMRFRFQPLPWWVVGIDLLYQEVHWAFYRAALGVALRDAYAGVFLGLGLVYLEWGLNPFWRRDWTVEEHVAGRWLHLALALISAILFLFTRNLWVCLAVHGALEFAFRLLGRERRPEEAPTG